MTTHFNIAAKDRLKQEYCIPTLKKPNKAIKT